MMRPGLFRLWSSISRSAGEGNIPRGRELRERRGKDISEMERVKSSLNEKMKGFEQESEIVVESKSQALDRRSDQEISVVIKGKEYIPQRLTAEEVEFKRGIMKKKGIVDILRKIRSQEDSQGLYTMLRDEEEEDVYNAINSNSFTKMAPQHILRALVYCQKTRLVKLFNSNSLQQSILKVATYLRKLTPQEVATFASFLNKAKLHDEVI